MQALCPPGSWDQKDDDLWGRGSFATPDAEQVKTARASRRPFSESKTALWGSAGCRRPKTPNPKQAQQPSLCQPLPCWLCPSLHKPQWNGIYQPWAFQGEPPGQLGLLHTHAPPLTSLASVAKPPPFSKSARKMFSSYQSSTRPWQFSQLHCTTHPFPLRSICCINHTVHSCSQIWNHERRQNCKEYKLLGCRSAQRTKLWGALNNLIHRCHTVGLVQNRHELSTVHDRMGPASKKTSM